MLQNEETREKVVIIGGGIGGLALANLLAKKGHDVHVYEKNSQLGGRAGERTHKGFTFDSGPSWYLMPKVFKDYFALFDVNVDKELAIKRLSPGYKVFLSHTTASPFAVTSKRQCQLRKIEPGAGDALRRYVDEGDYIYQMALKHFLYTDFSRLHQLAKGEILKGSAKLLTLLATPIHSRVKKFVKSRPLQQILEYPMVFLGTSPFKAPAMYSLMSALDFKEGVYYPAGGMYSIIRLMVAVGKNTASRTIPVAKWRRLPMSTAKRRASF